MPLTTGDILIDQGASTTVVWRLLDSDGRPTDLTGVTARLECRRALDPTSAVLFAADSAPLPSEGTITLTPAAGQVTLILPYALTATFAGWTDAPYDLLLFDGSPLPGTRDVQITVRTESPFAQWVVAAAETIATDGVVNVAVLSSGIVRLTPTVTRARATESAP